MVDLLKRYIWKLCSYTKDYPKQSDIGNYCWIKTNRLHPTEHLCRITRVEGEEGSRKVLLMNVEREDDLVYEYREEKDKPWFCVWPRPVEQYYHPHLESEWVNSLIPTDIVSNLNPHMAIYWKPNENDEDAKEFVGETCTISDNKLSISTKYGYLESDSPVWIVKIMSNIILIDDEDFQESFVQVPELIQ